MTNPRNETPKTPDTGANINIKQAGKVQKKAVKKEFRFKRKFTDHLVHAVLIFASVFVAFWLNDFRQKQIQKNETAKALEAVISEVEANLDILERWTPYHKGMLTRLEELFEKDSVKYLSNFSLEILSENYRGIMREILTRHAWDYIHAQNIQFDLDTRLDIIMIYEQQKFVENSLTRLIEMLYQRETLDPEKTTENYAMLYSMLGDLWGQEMAMMENYRYRLNRLKNPLK